jgi:hypothetical protein
MLKLRLPKKLAFKLRIANYNIPDILNEELADKIVAKALKKQKRMKKYEQSKKTLEKVAKIRL